MNDQSSLRHSSDTTIVHRLLHFARPYSREIGLSIILSAATTAVSVGMLGTSAFLIATAALHPSIAVLQVAIVGVRTFGIARGVFRYLERLVSHSVNFRLLGRIRGWFFQSMEPLVPGGIEDLKSGDLLARSIQDIETLEDFYVRGIAPPLSAVLVTIGISLFTLQYSITLAAILAFGLILAGLVLSLQVRAISQKRAEAVVNTRARLSALAVDTIYGAGTIVMSGAQENHLSRIRSVSREASSASLSLTTIHSSALAMGVLISNLSLVGMLYFGIPLVRSGRIDGVTLAVLALITLASFEPVNLLPAASAKIEISLAAARRLFDIADRPLPVTPPLNPVKAGIFRGLTIQNLNFTYPGSNDPALKDISLSLTPGKKIALVGSSGSGKSTLIKAIQNHIPVPIGCVFWNGIDSLLLSGEDIRLWQAVLSQNGYLFSASLTDNLKLSNPDRSEFENTLRLVGLEKWYSSLPDGMDTWLGDNGSQLSGGERQRLLLARTILLNRPIILADEPVSNLDLSSELEILRLLLQSGTDTSCLLATHRLTGMDLFDEILVMDKGKIIQRGTHSQLAATPGLYRNLWQQQNNLFSFDL
jgi:ATP-binding cassette, subfamily C, bacterial CydC